MNESEVEEGEACYYRDNSSIDPEIALSYIDEKVQNVLGHFQKDFEGGVTAENLGAKFGGYGSFLPTYQRSPSKESHLKSPREVQNFSSMQFTNVLHVEVQKGVHTNAAQSTRLGTAPHSLPTLGTAMAPSKGVSDKKGLRLSSALGKKPLVKEEPVLNKPANSSDQRTLKVRIKINSGNEAKNKAAIYSGLGLNTTPSSSTGNSHEDNSGVPSYCAGTLDESPSNVIQIMTSFPIPGGSPLSPLIESFLCLEKSKKHLHNGTPVKSISNFSEVKKKTVVEKRENVVISKREISLNLGDRRTIPIKPKVDIEVGNMENETPVQGSSLLNDEHPNPLSRQVSNIVDFKKGADMRTRVIKETKGNISGKNMEVNNNRTEEMLSLGFVREESLESISDQNVGFEKRDCGSSSIEKIAENRLRNFCRRDLVDGRVNQQSGRNENYSMSKADSEVSNCSRDPFGQTAVGHEKDEVELPRSAEESLSQGKKKSNRRQDSVDLASEVEGSLISGSYEVATGKKKSSKIRNLNINMVLGNCKAPQPEITGEHVSNQICHSPERTSGHGTSKSNRGVANKKQASSLNKSREVSMHKDVNADPIPDSSSKKSANDDNISQQVGLVCVKEPTSAEPTVIEEHWVQCDRCNTWRLLPFGTKEEQLPEKWVCRMLNWLPGMNRCDFSEDDTTQALRRLYQSENQSNLMKHVDSIVPAASSNEGLCLDMNHLNPSANCIANPRRMKPKPEETHCEASNGGSVQISGSVKNFQQDVVKSRSLNAMSQPFSNLASNSQKSSVEKNTHKHKEKHEKFGEAKEMKLKSKRAADQYEHGTPKRSRVDAVTGAVKTVKKVSNSVTTRGELLQSGSSEMKTCSKREISLKKRKLKDWQESQNCIVVLTDDGNHDVGKDFSKEETSDNEIRKVKKSAISINEGRESISRRADERFKRTGKVTKLKYPVHGNEEPFDPERGQQARKQKTKGSASDDMDITNMDLGSKQFSRASASSSSKVLDSLKSRYHFPGVKGSPVESVSSSPIRTLNIDQLSPARSDDIRKHAANNGHIPMVDSAKKSLIGEGNTEINQSVPARRVKVSGVYRSESPGLPALDFRDKNNGQNFHGKSRVTGESPDNYWSVHLSKNESENLENPCPGELLDRCHSENKLNKNHNNCNTLLGEKSRKVSSLLSKDEDESSGGNLERTKKVTIRPSEMLADMKDSPSDGKKAGDPKNLKYRIKLVKDDRDGKIAMRSDLTRIESIGGSSLSVVSNHVVEKDPPAQFSSSVRCSRKRNVFDVVPVESPCSDDSSKASNPCENGTSSLRNDASSQSSTALKKAEDLKNYGDHLKDSGFQIEGNEAYFQAVLHFLHAASLRESCNYDSNKHGEMSPMQIYSATAKLCELCANEYEKHNELAAAALAYKCMEVAYMRVVYGKNSTVSRDRHDLQASLHIIPQGESPSSSVSDVDSVNNQMMVDKAKLSKSIDSHAGNHIIVASNHPNFVRLLDFVKDVNSAMEASCKSQNTFAAAIDNGARSNEGIVSVKRVFDFSFQDVDELVRLVRAAINSINGHGFNG